ncbi:ribbon-helix-helix domain-containing protein [Candidatus Nitrospira salsa]
MRINARLNDEQTRKVNFLKEATNSSVSEVIKHALDQYYEDIRKTQVNTIDHLRKAGFIGCSKGPSNLSTTYKDKLAKGLKSKHDHRR